VAEDDVFFCWIFFLSGSGISAEFSKILLILCPISHNWQCLLRWQALMNFFRKYCFQICRKQKGERVQGLSVMPLYFFQGIYRVWYGVSVCVGKDEKEG
jgi:hypothetical protein